MAEDKKSRPKTFIIQHRKTKRQRNKFERLVVPLRHLPEHLSKFTVTCPSCRIVSAPDWFQKREIPMVPVKPRFETKGVEYKGPRRWRLVGIEQECPHCKANIAISLPNNKMRTKGSLFGDDAERKHQDKTVYIYSLVGVDQELLPEFDAKVKDLKQKNAPVRSC